MTTRVEAALKAAGATLVRRNKHLVYKLGNGKTFVMSFTPSDWRAEKKQLRDLKRLLRPAA